MSQCLAHTALNTQCAQQVKPPSRSLCGTHANAVARGTVVVNHQSGRKFPARN